MFEQSKINPDEVASVTIGTTVISFSLYYTYFYYHCSVT